jgi:NodT family efflux transporter outer membrane factor (OMF) lipoprotein
MSRHQIIFAVMSLLLASCAVGPDYQRPEAATQATFKEAGNWKVATPNDDINRGKWWEAFGDRELNALVEQVDINNQNLKLAEAKYRQAQALGATARSSFFPTISASASRTRSKSASGRTSVNVNTNTSTGSDLQASSSISTSHNLSASFSWELDLWGRIRRQVESNDASIQASAADLESARLSAQSELASNYFQLRVSDAQKQLLNDTVAAYAKSLELTKNRYNVGVAGRVDVVQAETQLKSAEAQALDLGVQRAQLEHAIALLIGKAPGNFTLAESKWNVAVPAIPLALPASLLERRPDIAGAERRAAAANAQIGVAKAAYYPTLSLTGSGGYSSSGSSTLSDWISAPNRFWSLGPSLATTILDFGKRGAASDQAIAVYDQNVATYRQTVLQAFQDVEDNLAALRILEAEAKVQDEAVRAARESVALTLNQYKAGTVSYLNVVSVQTAQLANERSAMTLMGRQLTASVALIKALGGGWNNAATTKPL